MVFIGGLIGLHGIYQYFTHAEMPSYWADQSEVNITTRVFSIIGSPNILGALMVLILPVSISFVFSEKKIFKKIIFIGTTLAMCGTLVFTASRSAWIGFVVAMAVYFWMKDKRLIVLLVILVFAAYAISPTISSRVNYLLSPDYWASSATGGRVARYTQGFQLLRQNPWFGVGLGWFGGAVAQNYKIPDAFYVDSYFIKIAVEMGLVGLCSFIYLIYNALAWGARSVFRASDENKSLTQGIFAGMVGVIIPNFVENVFEVPMMVAYFWIFAAILIYLGKWLKAELFIMRGYY
jgi:O-antigen ligase